MFVCVCVCVYGWTGSLLLWSSTIFLLSVGSSMNGALLTIYWGSVTSRWRNHPPTVGKPGPTMRPKRPLFRQFSPATGTQDPPRPEIALRSSQTRKIAPKIRENPQFWFRVWSSGFHRPVLPTALILGQKRQNSPIKFPSAEHKFWNSWQILKNHHIFSHQITDNSVWKQELVLGATFPLKPTLFKNWPVFSSWAEFYSPLGQDPPFWVGNTVQDGKTREPVPHADNPVINRGLFTNYNRYAGPMTVG